MGALALLLVLLVSAALPRGAEAHLWHDPHLTEFDYMATSSDLVQALGTDGTPRVLRLPVDARAMVMAYNVPELGEAGPSIMIDGDVLAAIWSGNVTKWNDEAILQLNPGLAASLPDRNITIGYVDVCRLTSSCDMLKDALQSFSPAFATEFHARGRLLANMRFATEGRGRPLGESSRDRAAWLRAEPYGLAFLYHADALNAGYPVRSMAMFNRAGTLVEPSVGSVELAMRDVNDAYAAGNLTSDFHDPPGYGSWPLTHVLFATVANSLDDFARVDPTPAVHSIGYGATLRSVSTMADHLKLPTEVVKSSSSIDDKDRQADRTGDFGVSDESWRYDQTSDLAVMPTVAYSLVPAANLPTLRGLRLVLDFPTIAAIYLGEITSWSDSRIRALNDDDVCAELPDAEIHVVVDDVESDANELLTGVLSAKVPAFASAVNVSRRPTFPVMASNATLRSASGVIQHLTDTTHSFAVWYGYDLVHFPDASKHQRRISPVQAAGIKSDEGAILFADAATVGAALDEYVESQSAPRRAKVAVLDVSGPESWPMTVAESMLYRQSTMKDCSKATVLAEFLHWVLTDPLAESLAQAKAMVPASSNAKLKRFGLNQLAHFTCEGAPVIAIAKLSVHQSELDHETSEQRWTISMTLGTIMKIIFTILAIIVGIVMHFLHSSGLVHMNLTSRNVLVTDHYKIRVSGFGLSKFKSLLRGERRSVRLRQSPVQADVYAFGIILWEFITRKHPSKLMAWIDRHHSGRGLSDEDGRLVSACLPLIDSCCRSCPAERPSFLTLMLALERRMPAF